MCFIEVGSGCVEYEYVTEIRVVRILVTELTYEIRDPKINILNIQHHPSYHPYTVRVFCVDLSSVCRREEKKIFTCQSLFPMR